MAAWDDYRTIGYVRNLVYDVGSLSYVDMTQPGSGGGPSADVTVLNFPATQPVSIAATVGVSGPLTDAQLRATDVPVSGTFWQAVQPVSGPLTDAQLRATAVPVSGTVTAAAANPYAQVFDESADPVLYVCEAPAGSATASAVWRIKRVDVSTGITTWADGNTNFDNVADNRAALSYS